MATAFESIASATVEAGSTITITKPSGVVSGDLMIAIIGAASADTAASLAGWTVSRDTASEPFRVTALFRVAGGSEGTDYTFDSAADGQAKIGCIVRISGAAFSGAANIVVPDNFSAVGSTATPTYANPITQATSGILLYGALAYAQVTTTDQAITNDNPTWTERLDLQYNATEDVSLSLATATATADSSTGNQTLTLSGAAQSMGFIISVKENTNVTVSPAVITITASIPAPTVTGNADVSPAVITITASVQAPTVTTAAAKWSNTQKSSAPSWSNTQKS